MINETSSHEEYLEHLKLTETLDAEKERILSRVNARTETLCDSINGRYKEASNSKAEIPRTEIAEELNLVLRDAIIDTRGVIMIPSGENKYNKKCVTRSYGFKTYKAWGPRELPLKDSFLTKDLILKNRETESYLDLSVLINHKDVGQKKIKTYFRFVRKALNVFKSYKINIEGLDEQEDDPIEKLNLSDLTNNLSTYQSVEAYKEKIENIPGLDKLYERFKINIIEFNIVSEKFLEEIKEYNKPFRFLVQLQDSK